MADSKIRWATPVRAHYRVFANRIGLQLVRVILFELQYRLRRIFLKRRFKKSDFTRSIEKNGYVVIKDFLPAQDYETLKDHYYKLIGEAETPTNEGPKLVAPTVSNPRNGRIDPIIEEIFLNNDVITEIVENASAHRQYIPPLIRLHHYWTEPDDLGIRESARTDELHYDVPLKNMRGFFYMEDCDRRNAAFEFAPGTHRFSLKRLYMEYVDSLVQSRAREGQPNAKLQPIRSDLQELLVADPIPVEAKGNSLILFNTMGLHRRGRFLEPKTREAILLDFRYLDSRENYSRYPRPLKWLMRVW